MRRFKNVNRNQLLVLPPSLDDWLPGTHPARFVVDTVDSLELRAIYDSYETGKAGQPPYEPRMMLGLLFYGHMVGVTSSRKLEQALLNDLGFRFIAANQHPDHDTIADFRKRHARALKEVFAEVVQLAMKAHIVRLGHVAVDGTKIRSNASRAERKTKAELLAEKVRIGRDIDQYFKECDEEDAREDVEHGKGKNGYLLPEHLADEKARQQWIREQLKEQAAEKEQETEVSDEQEKTKSEHQDGEPGDACKKKPSTADRKNRKFDRALKALEEQVKKEQENDPKGKLKRKRERRRGKPQVPTVNPTDTDSRLMLFPKGMFAEGYNCQIAVDDEAGVIVAADVTQEAGDQRQLLPIVLQVQSNTQWLPDNVTADNGYLNIQQIEDERLKSVEFYIPPNKSRQEKDPDTKSQWMRDRLETELGSRLYGLRKTIVEPVFGQIKHARKFRQFLLRGKDAVTGEWMLWCTAHNLLKLFKNECLLKPA